METAGTISLKKGKEHSVERFHPWIFSGAIDKAEGNILDGNWVELKNYKGKTLGFGHYQQGSITVRMLSFAPEPPNANFYTQRFDQALLIRKNSGLPNTATNAFRLVHAEGDGLPGLIVDVYGDTAVIQAHTMGMHADRHVINSALAEVLGSGCNAIYYRNQISLPGKPKADFADGYLLGDKTLPCQISEHGSHFLVDWVHGQKTGFFLDQRENRELLKSFSRGKSVLNTFCYTGGFSVSALVAGASLVHSVDASEKAIELAKSNIEINGFSPDAHGCFVMDTFDFIKDKQDVYDVIVLDPPAFAKHREARHQAVKGYQRLNAEAIKAIRHGGIIFTFSCSGVVDRQLFYDTIVSAAIQTGREVKVLHHLSQPADHPVSLFHPEGEYLKGLVLFVV